MCTLFSIAQSETFDPSSVSPVQSTTQSVIVAGINVFVVATYKP